MSMSKTDADKEHAARVAAELKQTEDLLAGFDRPARTPRTPAVVNQDFVDFHLKKGSDPNLRAASGGVKAPDLTRGNSTFLIRRKGTFPKWGWWAALFITMPVGGVLFTYCALTRETTGPSTGGFASQIPSAATTISAASTPVLNPTTGPERDIPPPPPPAEEDPSADPSTMAAPSQAPLAPHSQPFVAPSAPNLRPQAPTGSSPAAPRASSSASPASTVPPNPDFIRVL